MSLYNLSLALKHLPGKHPQQTHGHGNGNGTEAGETNAVVSDPNMQALTKLLEGAAMEDFTAIKRLVKKHKLINGMTPIKGKKQQYEKEVSGGKLHLSYEISSEPVRIRGTSLSSGTKLQAIAKLQFVKTGDRLADYKTVPVVKLTENTSGYGNNSAIKLKFADAMVKLGFEHTI